MAARQVTLNDGSPALGFGDECRRQVTPMLPRVDDDTEDSTCVYRVLLRLHGPRTTWVSLWLETSISLYLMLYAWTILYLNLFSVSGWLCDTQKLWCDIGFCVAVWMSFVTICDSIFFYIMGACIYGRLYARQLTFLFAILSNIVIMSSLLASHRYYWFYLYALPLACSYRLLINPAYVYKRKAWNGRSQKNVGLAEVLSAIDAVPDLSNSERAALKNAADDASKLGIRDNQWLQATTFRAWGSDQIHRFIHAAEVALTSAGSGLEKFAEVQRADRLLIRIMKSLGSNVGRRRNYDILATQRSLMRHFFRGQLPLIILFSVLSLIDAVLVSVVQTWLVDRLVSAAAEADRENARSNLLLYLGTYIVDIFVYALQINASSLCLAAAVARLQKRIAAGMLSMGPLEHAMYPGGSILATFSSDIARMDALWQAFCWAMVAPLCRVVVAMIYTIYRKPEVGVLAVTVFPLIFTTIPQSRSASASARQAKSTASTINMFSNGVACQRMIWLCDHQRHWLHQYLGPLIIQQRHANFRSKYLAGLVQGYAGQIATLFVGVHVAVFAWLVVEGAMTVPEFTAMMSLFLTLSGPIKTFAGYVRVVVTNAGSAQRIDEFIDATTKAAETTRADDVNLEVNMTRSALELSATRCQSFEDSLNTGLRLQDISFKYASSKSEVIKSVSLHAQAGEFVAIVGENGCGKSTLLSLIMTWLQPTDGSLSLNDTSLAVGFPNEVAGRFRRMPSDCGVLAKPAKQLRAQMAVVLQDSVILKCSIHENISFGAPAGTTREDVEWAAGAAGIAEFINTLPRSYDTELGGAGGVSFSGGQTQRICIARALCRKPKLLLLDEATSALDVDTEEQVLQTISSLRTTYPVEFASLVVICITHHPETLKYADVVVKLAGGSVASIQRQGGSKS